MAASVMTYAPARCPSVSTVTTPNVVKTVSGTM